MQEFKIPEVVQKAIDSYKNLQLGGKGVDCPYFINSRRRRDLRAMVGKGSPEEIIMEARIWEKLKGSDFNKMSSDELKQFLIDRGLGIDCSGFVAHVLDAWVMEVYKKHIWEFLKLYDHGFFSWLRYMLRPIEQLGANVITGPQNSYPITINEARPGDVIRSKWKKTETHHIQLITEVMLDDNNNVAMIEYTHSTPYYGKANGVKTGQIKIIDPNKTLKDQEWVEKDENGVNFSYEGFMTNVEDNGLRRLFCLKDIEVKEQLAVSG